MYYDKILKSVAEAVKQVVTTEKLHPNQQKLDVHEPEKDKLTAKDFEMLRKGKKAPTAIKEEDAVKKKKVAEGTIADDILEKIDEMKGPWPGTPEYKKKFPEREMKTGETKETKTGTVKKTNKGIVHTQKTTKEEVEQIDEISKGLATSYLNKRTAQHKPNLNTPETNVRDAKVAKGIVGAQNREHGYGRDKNAENKVTGRFDYRKKVGTSHVFNKEEVEQIDERSLTEPEMKKREDVVKSMKKGIQGFKQRYGEKAKSVMYATATKIAKKD